MRLIRVADNQWSTELSTQWSLFPNVGSTVDGLSVLEDIPNTSSISATFTNYEVISGVKELRMSLFGGPESVFYARDDFDRSKRLAEEIRQSGQIKPLIVVVDEEGPYLLEGAHRFVALHILGKKSFPALIVIDKDDEGEADEIN